MTRSVLSGLNPSQLSAVKSSADVLVINAGPGTGKTRTLTARIAYLISEKHVDPTSILAITFTKKAAAEMKERLQQIISSSSMPYIGTFHAFAYEVLTKEKDIKIVESSKQKEIIENVLKNRDFAYISKKDADRTISLYKSRIKNHSSNLNNFDTVREKFVLAYNESLKSYDLYDYDDLLVNLYELLQKKDPLCKMHERYKHVLVDEFQDTNAVQYEIVKKLHQSSLFLIGDPRQSIYSFRGASENMFVRVTENFPHAEYISLPINYRSAQRIIHVSSLLFPVDEKLLLYRNSIGLVRHITSLNEYAEADYIVRSIIQHVGGTDLLQAANITDHAQTVAFSDIAVIYRNHHVSTVLQDRLFNAGIPFQAIAAESPYKQHEVQFLTDCLNYFYDRSDQSLSKISEYPFIISRNHLQVIFEQNQNTSKPSILIQKLVQHFRLLDKLKDKKEELRNLIQFQNSMTQFNDTKKGLEQAVKYLQYLSEREYYDPHCDKVTLLTMHASKGLEFRVVFLCGFEEGIIPAHSGSTQLEEEKRLLYVALTRAKDTLYLISSQNRNKKPARASQFLTLIACEELDQIEDEETATIKKKIEKAKIKKSQMKLF